MSEGPVLRTERLPLHPFVENDIDELHRFGSHCSRVVSKGLSSCCYEAAFGPVSGMFKNNSERHRTPKI